MKEGLFRFRSVFVRETRVERASRGASNLTILESVGGVDWCRSRESTGVSEIQTGTTLIVDR